MKIWRPILLSLIAAVIKAQAATIQVLVVYDTTAKTWADNNGGGMATFAAQTVNKMNQATLNSGIDLTFELAYAGDVAYTYSSLATDLDALQAGSGTLATAHQWRDLYAADVVLMLEDTGSAYGYVGYGYMLGNTNGSPSYAFTVNSIRSVAISHTATHEVGHNLGAHHSKFQIESPGPNTNLNTYSAGWYFTGTNGVPYHTIMAYNSDGYDNYYSECPQFSSPLKTYMGITAGHAANGDNARTLRETMNVVAGYRSAPPLNDNFTNAFTLTGSSGTAQGSNNFATAETGEPAHADLGPYRSVWFSFTPASNGVLTLDTHGSSFDTVLAVYTGTSVNALSPIVSNDDDGTGGGVSGTNLMVFTGVNYRIALASYYSNESGAYTLHWAYTGGQPAGALQFSAALYMVSEDGGSATVRVSRVGGSAGAASAVYATVAGTATAGADFISATGSLTWANWDNTDRIITIPILNDGIKESSENFTIALSNITSALAGAITQATVQVIDDEPCTVPYTENFESAGSLPQGWNQDIVSGGISWVFMGGGVQTNPATAHGGSYNACLSSQSTNDHITRLISPKLDFGAYTLSPTLTFWHCMKVWPPDQDHLRLYYKTASGNPWTLLATYTNNVATWTQRSIPLPSPSASYFIAFEGNARFGYGVCIDDVAVTAARPPLTPQGTPYTWLDRYSLLTDQGNDDTDSLLTWQEYLTGTSPISNDTFAINSTLSLSESGFVLTWHSSTNGIVSPYLIEYCTNLLTPTPVWRPYTTAARTPPINSWTGQPNDSLIFYRVTATNY